MAFTSKGYAGPVLPADWSLLSPGLASVYNVEADGLKATPTGTLQTSISAGSAAGYGISDTEAAATVLTHSANSVAGTTRYDLVRLRRTWSSSTSALYVASGNVSQTTAIGARTVGRNVVDDQPLWLIPVINGASSVGTPIDLRVWTNNGGCTANSELVLQYLTTMGSSIQIGNNLWSRIWVGGVATWVSSSPPQAGYHDTAAGPETKTSAGAALTTNVTITGPPRPHSIYLSAIGQGGFDDAAASVAFKFAITGPGSLHQSITPVTAPALQWVSIVQGGRITGLPANAVTQIQLQASGTGVAYRRGGFTWQVA